MGIIIINKNHLIKDDELLSIYEIRYQILESKGWDLVFIPEDEWNKMNKTEK